MSPRWKNAICAAAMAATLLGCRKSEKPGGPEVSAAELARHPPFGFIDTPKENDVVQSGSPVIGWALDASGVASVTVALDTASGSAATLNQPFPGVHEAYPTYPGSDHAGFQSSVPSAAAGPHLLVVTVTGKDGGKTDLKRHIQIK